ERTQFDRPIAGFQLVQAMIADMAVRTDAARMLVYRAGAVKDAGKRSTLETSIAKYFATEAAVWCANTAIQVHGGARHKPGPSGRPLLPRRPRDDDLRGHLADPAADHRPPSDRARRAQAARAGARDAARVRPHRGSPHNHVTDAAGRSSGGKTLPAVVGVA